MRNFNTDNISGTSIIQKTKTFLFFMKDKQYTTKRISPENPKPCGCTSKSHLLPRCSNVVRTNES